MAPMVSVISGRGIPFFRFMSLPSRSFSIRCFGTLSADRFKFLSSHLITSDGWLQLNLSAHHLANPVKTHRKADFLGDSLHAIVLRQDLSEYAFGSVLPAEIYEELQELSPEPLALEAVTDDNGELCFIYA